VIDRPAGHGDCNVYTTIIIDEALRRGISVEILDPETGEMRLQLGDHRVDTIQSLSDLTSAVALRRCDDKTVTRRVLEAAGLPVPDGMIATGGTPDERFLERHGDIVVKPARGEGGHGITAGVTDSAGLAAARDRAAEACDTVLLEQRCPGTDLRVVVIADEVVAASVRRPPTVVGDGSSSVRALIDARNASADPGLSIPVDDITEAAVHHGGYALDDVLPDGEDLVARATANLHTGGTIHDVTDRLHPDHADVSRRAARALALPVAGVDLMAEAVDQSGQRIIEVNEQPGLANHEPRPTAQRYLDLLFPETAPSSGDH
jgi:GNAT-family acetyltransferase (TIGR03103 family)